MSARGALASRRKAVASALVLLTGLCTTAQPADESTQPLQRSAPGVRRLKALEPPWRLFEHRLQLAVIDHAEEVPWEQLAEDPCIVLAYSIHRFVSDVRNKFATSSRYPELAMTFGVIVFETFLAPHSASHFSWASPGIFRQNAPRDEIIASHGMISWPWTTEDPCRTPQDPPFYRVGRPSVRQLGMPCTEGGSIALPYLPSKRGLRSCLITMTPRSRVNEAQAQLAASERYMDIMQGRNGMLSVVQGCAPPEVTQQLPVDLTYLALCLAQGLGGFARGIVVVPTALKLGPASAPGNWAATQKYGFSSPGGTEVLIYLELKVWQQGFAQDGTLKLALIGLP